ncbi:hypothetical protein DFQ29_004314 [Apophysomyces sp. BC1021]|nr:hypothetical protein DFQ29_004314 [Apophysomyces sp. BC1021]
MLPTFADQLTHLTLRGKDARKLHSCSTLIPFLASLPRLQALTIGDLEDAWAYSELALDLTTIHQLLPDLSYLELWNVCLGPPLSSGGITIHGAAKLHTLKLMSHLSSWHWFHYLAYTYPNIKTMILNLRLKVLLQRSMSPKDFVEAQEAFLIMARSYTRLSTVVVDISPKLWPGQRFLDTLERTGTCLKEYHCIQKGWTPQMLKALTVCGATTLSKVHISLWKGTRDLLEIIQPLANCRQLEDLDLSCGEEDFVVHNSCTLNVFLNHLPNLKHLTLHTCTLYVSQEKDYTSEHGLRQLTLEDVCFSTAVMDYVSRRCRSLCDLRLDYCTKLRDHTHQEIRIDMPHHVFRSIRICHTFLSSEDRKRCNVDSTLLSLAQLDKQRRWRKNTDLDGLTRWYHMGDTNGNKVHEEEEELTRGWCLQRLTHEEIRLVKSFRMEPQQWKNLENAIRNTYKTKKRWETDLPYGYISIRCRSVDRLTFNHVEL